MDKPRASYLELVLTDPQGILQGCCPLRTADPRLLWAKKSICGILIPQRQGPAYLGCPLRNLSVVIFFFFLQLTFQHVRAVFATTSKQNANCLGVPEQTIGV